LGGGGDATRPLPRDGVWRNFTETRQSGYTQRLKMEKVVTKKINRDKILWRVLAGAARSILLLLYLA